MYDIRSLEAEAAKAARQIIAAKGTPAYQPARARWMDLCELLWALDNRPQDLLWAAGPTA